MTKHFAVIAGVLTIVGCSQRVEEPPAPAPTNFISYHMSTIDAEDDAEFVLDRCTIGGATARIGIVEVVGPRVAVPKDCGADPAPSRSEYAMEVLVPVAGELPTKFTMAAGLLDVSIGRPEVGDRYLVSLRPWDEVYVVIHAVEVSFEPNASLAQSRSSAEVVDLPTVVSELVDEVRAGQQDATCERTALFRMDDATFDSTVMPASFCDDPGFVPVGTCVATEDCGSPNLDCVDGTCVLNCTPDVDCPAVADDAGG